MFYLQMECRCTRVLKCGVYILLIHVSVLNVPAADRLCSWLKNPSCSAFS